MRSFVLLLVFASLVLSQTHNGQTTSYGWNDNDPPSAQISYPRNGGYPTLHNAATEGVGTINDPVTFATNKDEVAIGTIVYVPHLRKYFVMEDDCAQCDSDWKNGKYHIDLWMGPQRSSNSKSLDDCENYVTRDNVPFIVKPAGNLPVEKTPLYNGTHCTAKVFG